MGACIQTQWSFIPFMNSSSLRALHPIKFRLLYIFSSFLSWGCCCCFLLQISHPNGISKGLLAELSLLNWSIRTGDFKRENIEIFLHSSCNHVGSKWITARLHFHLRNRNGFFHFVAYHKWCKCIVLKQISQLFLPYPYKNNKYLFIFFMFKFSSRWLELESKVILDLFTIIKIILIVWYLITKILLINLM